MSNTTADIVGEDPRIAHLERTKQDTERELSRVADELAHVRETGAAELARASDDLVSAAAELDALRAEVTRQTGIAVDHCARADDAERMVAEMRDRLRIVRESFRGTHYMEEGHERAIDTALASTAEVAGRWVSKADFDGLLKQSAAECMRIAAERDAAIAARDEAEDELGCIKEAITQHLPCYVNENDEDDELDAVDTIEEAGRELAHLKATVGSHVSAGTYAKRVDERDAARAALATAERARDEVGIQLAAAQAEIARMRPVVEAARALWLSWVEGSTTSQRVREHQSLGEALTALDAVPGDALAQDGLDDDTIVKCEGCSVVLPVESAVDGSDGDGGIWLCTTCADDLARDAPVVPPSPAGASAPASGSTPAASSATSSSSEVAANPSAPRGMCDRITAALEASGIDTDNVKGVE